VTEARQFYGPVQQGKTQLAEPQRVIVLPEINPETLRGLGAAEETAMRRMRVPVILNFPVAIAQVPYMLVTRRELLPQGMLIQEWRALSWPFAGLLFWWLAGRGIEALSASFRSTLQPRLSWAEVIWAIVLLVVGIVTLIGIATTTPDDRHDKDFMALMYGGLLWGVLAGLTLTARFRQSRIYKRKAAESGPLT